MRIALLFLSMLLPLSSSALEIADIRLEDSIKLETHALVLSGAGVRTKFMFKVYVGGLYLTQKAGTAEAVLADEGAKRMTFYLLRDVTGKQVLDGINEAILPNNSAEEMQVLEARLEAFAKIFRAVPEIKQGEVVNLDYVPGIGTRVTVKGALKGVIEGIDYNRALLRIWVGKHPVQSSLKKSILGGA